MAHPFPTRDELGRRLPHSDAREILADGVLTIPAALALAGCGRTTLYAAIARGELPTVHHGRRTTIPRRALVDWLAERLRVAGREQSA